MTFQSIEVHTAHNVARLTLRRPPLNVLNIDMLRELETALETIGREATLKLLIVRAEGTLRVFSAGVDVADHLADKVDVMIPLFDRVCATLANFPAPTLAVVCGHALGGGCELALCCDLVVAAETANFAQPEIKLATIAPIAALQLPGLIGYRRAAEMLFSGETIGAAEAARIGLINRAVPIADLDQAADQLIGQLSALSAAALRVCKRALRSGTAGWEGLPAMEKLYLDELMSTHDAPEGLAAFLEKRVPVWSDD